MKKLTIFLLCITIVFVVTCINSRAETKVEKHVLSNGLTLILDEQHSRDLISLCLLVDGSLRIEDPSNYGISHFIEHLVFRGPTQNTEELELRRMFRIWGDFSGYTTDDYTCYGFTVRPENFDEALNEFVDGVMNLTIPESVIEKERSVVTREIDQRIDIPNVRLFELFNANEWKTHSYHNPVIGYRETISGMPSDSIRQYYRDHYTPDHMVISVTGDFIPQEMISRIDGAFGNYKSSGKDFDRGIYDPPQVNPASAVEKADINSMMFLGGWSIPPAKDPDTPVLEVLAEILGGGEDSRLYKALISDSSLAEEAASWSSVKHDAGVFNIYAVGKVENLEKIKEAALKEIYSLKDNPPTADEINRAKKRLTNGHNFGLQTYWDIAQNLAVWEIFGNLDYGYDWIDKINSVTQQQLVDEASKIFTPSGLTWVALEPSSAPSAVSEAKPDATFDKSSPVQEVEPGKVVSETLTNGAKLIFKRDTATDIVGISVLAGYGQVMEPDGKQGIGEFTARMLMKGCGNLDSTEFRRKTEELGCQITSSGSRDYLNVSMEISKDRLDEGLDLLAKVLFSPQLDPVEIETVRTEISGEIQRREDSPFDYVNDKFFAKIYGNTPYGYPVLGRENTVKSITVDDLKAFHQKAFATKDLVISIVGDIDYGKLNFRLPLNLGRITNIDRSVAEADNSYPESKIPAPSVGEDLMTLPRSQVSFDLGAVGISASDPDYMSLSVLVRILGLRVFDKYVYDLGWAYRMWFFMSSRRGPSPIMFEMGVDKSQFEAAREGLIESMRDIMKNPVPEDELKKAQVMSIQGLKLAMQKNVDTAYYLAYYEKIGAGYELVLKYDEIINSITSADLARVGRKYFNPDKMQIVAIIPSGEQTGK